MQPAKYSQPFLAGAVMHPEALSIPFSWKKPSRIFLNSMSDLFHKDVTWNFIYKVFEVMMNCPQHTFIIATKRHQRLTELAGIYLHLRRNHPYMPVPLTNVWILVSVEDQESADKRIPYILDPNTPIAVRGISAEPLIAPLQIAKYLVAVQENGFLDFGGPQGGRHALQWVICGGESGSKASPMHPDWARRIRDDCKAAGVPFFLKQWGEYGVGSDYNSPWKHYAFCNNGDRVELHNQPQKLRGESYQQDEWKKLNPVIIRKCGKKKADRFLDGKEHLEYPVTSFPHHKKNACLSTL
jgi:protein gp37